MNSSPSPKKLSLTMLAVIGVILYLAVSFVPGLSQESTSELPSVAEHIEKSSALQTALQFVGELETPERAAAAKTQVAYDSDKSMNGYLTRFGLENEYAKPYAQEFPLEYYKVSVDAGTFHYYVYVSLFEPKIVGWLSETAGSAESDRLAEERLARDYLRGKNINPDNSTLVVRTPQNSADLSATFSPRTEYRFTETSAVVGEAELVRKVYIHDGKIVGYRQGFEAPPSHRDWQRQQDSTSSILSLLFYGLLLAFSLTAFILALVNRKRASFARGAAVTVIVAALMTVQQLNMSPVILAVKGDTFYPAMLDTIQTAIELGLQFLLIVGLYFIFVAGEEMSRQVGWNVWPRPSSPGFADHAMSAMKRGYKIALFMIGIQAFMFFVAQSYFGMWGINDPATSSLNMRWLWLYPLLAWIAAFQEEAIFRLFGISILYRMTRSKWAAVLLTSFVWSLGHAAYPLYPFYTRIWEVTLFGLLFGFAFLRYGFWTVVFAHAAANSLMTSLELISRDQSPGYLAAAVLYSASPLIVAWLMAVWARRREGRDSSRPPRLAG